MNLIARYAANNSPDFMKNSAVSGSLMTTPAKIKTNMCSVLANTDSMSSSVIFSFT